MRRNWLRERLRRSKEFGRRFTRMSADLLLGLLLVLVAQPAFAQLPKKLPSADKIVDNYLKAIGGKKAAGALKDTTYEWTIQLNDQPFGTARMQRKAPVVRTLGNDVRQRSNYLRHQHALRVGSRSR